MRFGAALVKLSSLLASTTAWGGVGHELIADIAADLLTPNATRSINSILAGQPLSSIASWCDVVKRLPSYRYSGEYHYINLHDDDPPFDCSFGWKAPGDNDVIAAIYNYTEALALAEPDTWHQSEALRFTVHLWEDMHQPLHCLYRKMWSNCTNLIVTGRDRGGNTMMVEFEGHKVSLHRVWDTLGLLVQRASVQRKKLTTVEEDAHRRRNE